MMGDELREKYYGAWLIRRRERMRALLLKALVVALPTTLVLVILFGKQ